MIRKTLIKGMTLTAAFSAISTFTVFGAGAKISESRAKEVAVNEADIALDKADFRKIKLEYKYGRYEYEVEFLYNGI